MIAWTKKLFIIVFSTLFLLISTPLPIHADIGPKPSVHVTIEGVGNQVYYATLLSKYESTGPESAYQGNNARYTMEDEEYPIWKAFVDYQDSDGFYFLQTFWECTDRHTFKWGYYPPETFKILLYFPQTNEFVVSDIHQRYAFESYFTMNVNNEVYQSYNYTKETMNLVIRIILTILLEIGIAFLFKIKQKDQLVFIAIVNTITQIGLNIALNVINFYKGQWAFTFYYALLEIAIIIIEAIFYRKKLQNKAVPYSFIANVLSFAFGLWLAHLIPGIF